MQNGFKTTAALWARWIILFPASTIGALLARGLFVAISQIGMGRFTHGEKGWHETIFYFTLEIAGSAVTGMSFIYIAWYIAPKHKNAVALTFCAITIFAMGASCILSILILWPEDARYDLVLSLLSGIAIIAGAVSAVYHLREECP
mgnify:CR=1 FL=1